MMRRHLPAPRAWFTVFLLLIPSITWAADLNQQTLNAWNEYIRVANSRMTQRLRATANFLWIDDQSGRRERVRRGEILVEPASEEMPEKIPQGLIHDWLGAVFIPNATIASVFAMLNDYGKYDQFYNPAVISAKSLNDSGPSREFSLLLAEKEPFVNAAIESEYTSRTIQVDSHHWYTISYSTRIQQIDDFGKPGQHVLPPDKGAGFIWRLYSIQRFEERDGGVYSELEAIALSRNVPFELQWLVRPILQRLPRNSMIATLQKTRNAVCAADNSATSEVAKLGSTAGGSPTANHDPQEAQVGRYRGAHLPKAPAGMSFGFRGPE